ncbi:MAG: adenosylmethionine--8-amino-7-oxononanoate transaminase [Candidatus Hydrogenedentes bacterium CG07_land_8_20_14_0_80_42_17]|nr:MAG: adenosylmethionine--8-amino-7-oxononanoate transaminase [Candidatus Hydrogenedentes bacterium CG07_land_8_20_14_0_80_42_17]
MKRDSSRLKKIDTWNLWHPFTQMQTYAEEGAPIIERGEGIFLFDTDGKKYYDSISSLWCNVHGHRHPRIDNAIKFQLEKIAHSTLLGLGSVSSLELTERLVKLTGMPHVFYADSGSGAVEIALKVAYQFSVRRKGKSCNKFVSFKNAYHGDTLGSVSVGGIDIFHSTFKPLLFETLFAPSPYAYRWPTENCKEEALKKFEEILNSFEKEISAVVIEPMVQGAAGMILEPSGFLSEIRRMTAERDIILICDEVATGFGRTGKMFAVDHESVKPDVLVLGKGITGGYLPLSAACFTTEIFESFLGRHEEMKHFFHGHTYTGNALASAAAIASLEVFEEEKTLEKLSEKIKLIEDKFSKLRSRSNVGDIRQCGMMAGIELVEEKATKKSFPLEKRMGHRVTIEARRRGMITRPLGDTCVFMPPLSSSLDELTAMLEILSESIEAAIGDN